MSSVDTRQLSRDSLFLLAEVRVEVSGATARVKVRNLSDGGMMADGEAPVQRGSRVTVDLRNIGPVEGSVAWVQDKRFGIAFDSQIDAHAARAPVGSRSTDSGTGAPPQPFGSPGAAIRKV